MAKSKGKKKHDKIKSTQLKEPQTTLHTGTGEFTLPNGDTYVGEYCAHRCGMLWRQGHGIYKTQDGQTYEGEWCDDKLVENKEIIINYPNGSKFFGCLTKNKYNGPGTYCIEGDMNVSCEFAGNKPTGTVALVDCTGKLWLGNAKENSAILIPENIFYLNLTDMTGRGLSKEPIEFRSLSISSSSDVQEEQLSDREWEKIIFAKSVLTDANMEFEECDWWKNYEGFRCRYDGIKDKIENAIALDDDDYAWVEQYNRYKLKRQMEKEEKIAKREQEHADVFALNQRFRSTDFLNSCPAVKVFYPTVTSLDKNDESSYKESVDTMLDAPVNKNAPVIKASNPLPPETLNAFAVYDVSNMIMLRDDGSTSSEEDKMNCSDSQLVKSKPDDPEIDKRKADDDELDETELHFTDFREQMLSETKRKLKEEKNIYAEKEVKIKTEEMRQFVKEPEEHEKDTRKKDKREPDTEAKGTAPHEKIVPLDKKAKLERKIQECVDKYLKDREERIAQKSKKVIEAKVKKPHTHDVAVCTESIKGLPRDLLLKK